MKKLKIHHFCFSFCDNFYESWWPYFYFGVTTDLMGAAQYNNFNSNDPQKNVRVLCQLMTDEGEGSPVERLAKLYRGEYSGSISGEYDPQYKEYDSWTHQKCNEFGWFKSSTAFTDYVSADWLEDFYCSQFGYTNDYIEERVGISLCHYHY